MLWSGRLISNENSCLFCLSCFHQLVLQHCLLGGQDFNWSPNYIWCAGLAYLHEECNPPVIHRDIKPTNILLDQNFHAKIANFGPNATHMLTGATGTPGYADPSYNCNSNPGASCDIHSFGVVLLQLVTGKPACDSLRDEAAYYITDWVHADRLHSCVS